MTNPVNMFNVGKSGLMVSKAAMTTTGHNIANVNTEGYSRQRVDQEAGPVTGNDRISIGHGVWAKAVTRANDEYLQARMNKEAKNFAGTEEKDIYLQQTEQIFNESNGDGINRLATRFFNEFRKLSADTGNSAIRASVRESSAQLANEVNRMDHELKEVSRNIDSRIEGYVREVNSLARQIRDINLLVQKSEMNGTAPPDLYDKRDLALKKLGEMADISVNKDKSGMVTVTMANRVPLIVGEQLTELQVMRTPPDPATGKGEGSLDIFVNEPVPLKVTPLLKTGRLGGLLEVRDNDIRQAQEQINEVAFTISKEVNNIHRQGFGLDGGSGRDFFEEPLNKESAAEMMRVSNDVMENLNTIAAAKEPNAPSDNRIAVALSGIGEIKGLSDSQPNSSILDIYNSMVSDLSVKSGENKHSLLFQKDLVTQLENTRESLVGVNLDEETSNLIQLQHAYAANAKVIQVADEVLQNILTIFK
jgi:flagellar hook-associated protein 1 FlgK